MTPESQSPIILRLVGSSKSRYIEEILPDGSRSWSHVSGTYPALQTGKVAYQTLLGLPERESGAEDANRVYTVLALLGFTELYEMPVETHRAHVHGLACWPPKDTSISTAWSYLFAGTPATSVFLVKGAKRGRKPTKKQEGSERMTRVALQPGVRVEIVGVSRRPDMSWREHAFEWLASVGLSHHVAEGLQPIHTEPNWFEDFHRMSCLPVGSFQTFWVPVEGDGHEEYREEDLVLELLDSQMVLRDEFLPYYDEVAASLTATGKFNGDLFALRSYHTTRSEDGDERFQTRLTFERCKYFDFYTSSIAPETASVRGSVLALWDPQSPPLEQFPNGCGVCLCVETSDVKWIFAQRSMDPRRIGPRRGEWDVSVVEGMNPKRAISAQTGRASCFHEARNGLKEELGLLDAEDYELHMLGFGVDLEYYQWNILGHVRTRLSFEEVRRRRLQHAKDRSENREIVPVDLSPKAVFEFLSDKRIWSSGLGALYYTLVHRFGATEVDQAALSHFRRSLPVTPRI